MAAAPGGGGAQAAGLPAELGSQMLVSDSRKTSSTQSDLPRLAIASADRRLIEFHHSTRRGANAANCERTARFS